MNITSFWINQDDRDIPFFLSIFTLLPMEEINRLGKLKDEKIREAKEILAYEATSLCHGKENADRAREASKRLFGKNSEDFADGAPNYELDGGELEQGIPSLYPF